jgi:ATP-dependent Clp protease ATP-binding subunit ClpA
MLDAFFNRATETLLRVIRMASEEAVRQKNPEIGTEHLLLGIAREPTDLASRALASMKIDAGSTQTEVDQYWRQKDISAPDPSLAARCSEPALSRACGRTEASLLAPLLSETAVWTLLKAEDYSRFLGQERVECAHLLLGILDLREAGAIRIFEQLSANLTFLRRQVIHLLARESSSQESVIKLKTAVVTGLKELVDKHESSLQLLAKLAERSNTHLRRLPSRGEILHLVCMGYLADFLYTQVAFQRYLLEETMALLNQRAGSLGQEISAAIVETGAQNLRADVRATIEYLWSHEYRLIDQMLDEAEHDVIGSIIEDLWWTQSEEIVLDKSYGSALEDHRRAQILSLQKRRIEVTQRLAKLKNRLDETVRQTFEKRSIPA